MSESQEQTKDSSTANLRSLLSEITPTLLSGQGLSHSNVDLLSTLTYQLAESLKIHYNDDIPQESDQEQSNERLLSIALLNLSLSYQTLYISELKKLSTAFGIESADDADELINEISKTLAIDPTKNLSNQLVLKFSFPNEDEIPATKSAIEPDLASQSSEASFISNEGSSYIDANYKKDQKIATLKSQISQLKEGVTSLQKKATKKISKYEKKISDLQKALQTEMSSKDTILQENKSLLIKVSSLESNVEELESQLQRQKSLEAENLSARDLASDNLFTSNLMESFSKLSIQYQNQLEEIQRVVSTRNDLLSSIKKYQELIKIYEEEMNKFKQEMSDHSLIENELTEFNIRPKSDDGNDELFDAIADSLSMTASPVVGDVVSVIQDGETPVDDRVKKIVDLLVDEINRLIKSVDTSSENHHKEDQTVIQNLLSALHCQLNFIERLSNSDQDRKWLVPASSSDDARKAIRQQANNLQLFLSEYAEGFTTDADLFDNIMINDDPQLISDKMQSFLTNFHAVRTTEGKELFAILRQSLAVCNILRRFAIESRSQSLVQAAEMRHLRAELSKARMDYEHRLETETAAISQRLEEEIIRNQNYENYIVNIKNILMSTLLINQSKNNNNNNSTSQLSSENDFNQLTTGAPISTIINCIEHCENALDETEHVNPVEYEQSLQRRLQAALESLERRESEFDGLKERAEVDVSSMSDELQDLREKAQTTIQKLNSELQDVKLQNSECLNEIATLNEQLEESQNAGATMKEQLKQLKEEYDENIEKKNSELESLKEKMDRRLTKAVMKIADKEKEKRTKLQARMQDVRNENQRLQENLNEKSRENQTLQEKYDLIKNQSLNNDKRRQETNRAISQNEIELRNQLQSLKAEISELQINNKVLTERAQKSEERYKTKIANVESVSNMRQESLKTEYETKFERMREEMKNDRKDLLTMLFTKNFRNIMRVPNPVTEEDAQTMLQRAAKIIGPRAYAGFSNSASVSASNSAFSSALNSGSNSPLKESRSLIEGENSFDQENK